MPFVASSQLRGRGLLYSVSRACWRGFSPWDTRPATLRAACARAALGRADNLRPRGDAERAGVLQLAGASQHDQH
eukprot:3244070-Alexandrium_andersonii.AAC.1